MNQKTFTTVVGIVFSVIAVLHLLRLLFHWEAVIGGWTVPTWVSWLALVLSGYLASSAFRSGGAQRGAAQGEMQRELEELEQLRQEIHARPDHLRGEPSSIIPKHMAYINAILARNVIRYNEETARATNTLIRLTRVLTCLTGFIAFLTVMLAWKPFTDLF